MFEDTIVAISTAIGESGIALIRMSGSEAEAILQAAFLPKSPQQALKKEESHRLLLGWITDENGVKLDEVLVSLMRAPHSYTGETVAEINCHGGYQAVTACLNRCLALGARMALPGEFTQRAFLNGRLDISQAEALMEVIGAKSKKGLTIAVEQLHGRLRTKLEELENLFTRLQGMILASIDFPDDVGELDAAEAGEIVQQIQDEFNRLYQISEQTDLYRNGIQLVICGKPNVGKSSLLNYLLNQEKAIVTNIPGTTRDIIEDFLHIQGIPVRIMDTAGIRETEEAVEKIGVQKTRDAIAHADVRLFLLDTESGITEEDLKVAALLKDQKNVFLFINKTDCEHPRITEEVIQHYFPDIPHLYGSIRSSIGMEALEDALLQLVRHGQLTQDDLEIVMNLRQKQIVKKCCEQVQEIQHILQTASLDCLAVEVDTALMYLGELSGRDLAEETLDRIFRDFCIGK